MKSNAILQSNLLDIIFENRNKDYGAYVLRKTYNKRLSTAVFIMIGIVSAICLLQIYIRPLMPLKENYTRENLPPTILTTYKNFAKPEPPSLPKMKEVKKINKLVTSVPVIVANDKINKPIATPDEAIPSQSITSGTENIFPGSVGNGNSNIEGLAKKIAIETIKEDSGPKEVAEIMPEYPGGTKALLAFLKKNIHSPQELEEEEVTVRIKFVVNYNGKVESFEVLQSGGVAFDDEVLRVLKKMPLWIPGKSKGENVSVYYNLPVKFRGEF